MLLPKPTLEQETYIHLFGSLKEVLWKQQDWEVEEVEHSREYLINMCITLLKNIPLWDVPSDKIGRWLGYMIAIIDNFSSILDEPEWDMVEEFIQALDVREVSQRNRLSPIEKAHLDVLIWYEKQFSQWKTGNTLQVQLFVGQVIHAILDWDMCLNETSRYVWIIQGILSYNHMCNVQKEREQTRWIFHAAYLQVNGKVPRTLSANEINT